MRVGAASAACDCSVSSVSAMPSPSVSTGTAPTLLTEVLASASPPPSSPPASPAPRLLSEVSASGCSRYGASAGGLPAPRKWLGGGGGTSAECSGPTDTLRVDALRVMRLHWRVASEFLAELLCLARSCRCDTLRLSRHRLVISRPLLPPTRHSAASSPLRCSCSATSSAPGLDGETKSTSRCEKPHSSWLGTCPGIDSSRPVCVIAKRRRRAPRAPQPCTPATLRRSSSPSDAVCLSRGASGLPC
mmetsp:Transcript_15220/g.46172  ORF Transcript_15220/g.46172 Transcript_15220/m.46172 type:complete len:246 (+) Transcript_15220:612-1349(+)